MLSMAHAQLILLPQGNFAARYMQLVLCKYRPGKPGMQSHLLNAPQAGTSFVSILTIKSNKTVVLSSTGMHETGHHA